MPRVLYQYRLMRMYERQKEMRMKLKNVVKKDKKGELYHEYIEVGLIHTLGINVLICKQLRVNH